ncbi:MAG: hypothetical protein RLZ98_2507 [Pseudomonadota bacterium]|jgi:membrane protein required for colicin V production
MIGPISILDAILISIALISGLLAMYRGLTREILSILSWVIAAGAAFWFLIYQESVTRDIAQQMAIHHLVVQIAIGAIIFLIVLIIVHLITAAISDSILESRIGMIDRTLGFVFGVGRGFIIVVILYMFYAAFVPADQQFTWVRQAKSINMIEGAGTTLQQALNRHIDRFESQRSER